MSRQDASEAEWSEAIYAKGHTPVLDARGKVDFFGLETDHHNGPRCTSCGWEACTMCEEIADIPVCGGPEVMADLDDKIEGAKAELKELEAMRSRLLGRPA